MNLIQRMHLVALGTIVAKEVLRFIRIWIQTIVPAVITTSLYFVIFGKLVGSSLYFEPKSLGSNVKFSYLKVHTTPVLDYYIDTNDIAIYFSDPTDVAAWSAGSYDSGDTVYYASNGHYYKANTTTVEIPTHSDWDIDEDYSHTLTGDELGSSGQTASTIVDSLTIEMDWRDTEKLIISDMLLERIWPNLKKMELAQYVELQKQERNLS